ncbi:GNAT family N-acetyltransferase [Aureimonas sp. AU40]|uniref:GNAT family N-acetyltransferase n=1 Tax=Aureimonas sp. AU40 TaxID=1637747 RepID=UPI000780C04D|nr:GNAT family N-acetyltransferase [Aureimonas sp. AU40]
MTPSFSLRPATPEDAEAIAALHVASWRETYAGLLPEAMLAELSVESRAELWRRILAPAHAASGAAVWLAEENEKGLLAGFGACGAQRDAELRQTGFDSEIGALYVLRAFQGRGLGRRLMVALAGHLAGSGRSGAALLVLRDNAPARRFYEALGRRMVGERSESGPEGEIVEIAYGWADLQALVEAASN